MKNIIFFILIFLFYSCESDPIQPPIHKGVQYKQYIFKLDDMIETYQDSAQFINTASGSLLTSGFITDSLVNTAPYDYEVKSIISLDLSKFFDYEYSICHGTEEN